MTALNHSPAPFALMANMPTNVLDSTGCRVARCDFDGDMDHPEAIANARLFVGAPQMFQAVLSIREALRKWDGPEPMSAGEFAAAVKSAVGQVPLL